MWISMRPRGIYSNIALNAIASALSQPTKDGSQQLGSILTSRPIQNKSDWLYGSVTPKESSFTPKSRRS